MKIAKPVSNMIESLQSLPSIGPRSAERLTYHLLRMPTDQVLEIANRLQQLKQNTTICTTCYNIAESTTCEICSDPMRDESLILIVEEPLDVIAIERTGKFPGRYHVLGGVIDPIRGIGADELRFSELMSRLELLTAKHGVEVILAMNPSTEGETTSMYLKKALQERFASTLIKITRIARGLPIGGDLEYADPMTLSRSLEGRGDY